MQCLVDPSRPVFPDGAYLRELFRPWKLMSFGAGMAWLIHGAINYHIADWDVGVSVVMGMLAYGLAPWSMHLVLNALVYRPKRAWVHVLLAVALAVLVSDTSYVIYHSWAGNQMYRSANFPASMSLYALCGAIWLPRMSASQALGVLLGKRSA